MSTSSEERAGDHAGRPRSSCAGPMAALTLSALTVSDLDVAAVEAGLGDVAVVRSWVSGLEAQLLLRSDELAAQGKGAGARETARNSGGRSGRAAAKSTARAGAIKANPTLGDDLASGETSEEHIDALADAAKDLDDDQRDGLFNDPELGDAARRLPPEPFASLAKRKAAQRAKDGGEDKLAAQKRATKVKTWVRKDGMHIINGEFDPETGSSLFRSIEAELDTLAQRDRLPMNDHTRAAALAALVDRGLGAGPNQTPPEVLVIDAATLHSGPHAHSTSQTNSGVDLPPETIRRAMCGSIIAPTVLDAVDGQVLFAGREKRVANRAQRQALRAMYPTCAFDGCTTGFDRCQMHHIKPWINGGGTDLDNLVPLCGRHHHLVHEGRWRIHLEPGRSLVIYEPGGRHHKTVPLPSKPLAHHLSTAERGTPVRRSRP